VRQARRGFTLIEILIVFVMIGIMMAIVIPHFRVSNAAHVRDAARLLATDLELARTRALTTTSKVRVVFDVASQRYTGYLDDDRNGVFTQNTAEINALAAFRPRSFTDGVQIGRGATPAVPGMAGAGAITLPFSRVQFATMGVTDPFGTTGVVYLRSSLDATAVAAVSITGAAGVRVWVYRGGAWQ
jgi:prepilin-type N-terminal cleavage/methylation domain-containing protein